MLKVTALVCLVLVALVAESSCQYRRPRKRVIIIIVRRRPRDVSSLTNENQDDVSKRAARSIQGEQPLWLNRDDEVIETSSDDPNLPAYIEDIIQDPNGRNARSKELKWVDAREPLSHNEDDDVAPSTDEQRNLPSFVNDLQSNPHSRHARSVDSPSAKRGGGSHTTSSSSRNTGATHPGYNRRNARSPKDLQWFDAREPLWINKDNREPATLPRYIDDIRLDPNRRYAREIRLPRLHPAHPRPKPRLNPFKPLRLPFDPKSRVARDIQIPGTKPTSHRDVIIPNWNPYVKTTPWERIGVRPHRNSREVEGSYSEDFE